MTRVPLVSCRDCGFTWNSAVMADGLRLLGACPKCQGELSFRAEGPSRAHRFEPATEAPVTAPVPAPHLVLGIPRR